MTVMRRLLAASAAFPALLIAGASMAGGPDDYPANALPGHCYQHVFTPPATEAYQDQVVDAPEHTATRVIPAVYGFVDKQVVVREGRTERYTIAPTYRTVTETIVVRPETTHTELIPAQLDTVTERVMVREAHTEWRRGSPGPVSDPDMPRGRPYGDILCLIAIPAEYRLQTRTVVRVPEHTVETTIPADIRTRTREVIDQPGHEERRDIPPVYSIVRERVVVQPERVETYTVPAVIRIVTKTRVVAPGHYDWREYACREVEHPHHPHPRDPATDGERGALDPARTPRRWRRVRPCQPARLQERGGRPAIGLGQPPILTTRRCTAPSSASQARTGRPVSGVPSSSAEAMPRSTPSGFSTWIS